MIQLEEKELYWLAGLLEGEAYFAPQTNKSYTKIVLQMTDEDIIYKVSKIFEVSYFKCKKRETHHKDSFVTTLRGKKALNLLQQINPIMSNRRQAKIQECIEAYQDNSSIVKKEQYEEVYNLKNSGWSAQQIGDKFGVTKWAIYRIIQKMGAHVPRQGESHLQ